MSAIQVRARWRRLGLFGGAVAACVGLGELFFAAGAVAGVTVVPTNLVISGIVGAALIVGAVQAVFLAALVGGATLDIREVAPMSDTGDDDVGGSA
jgi:urea transporter